ncbi:hypothetical protein RRU94_04025 [Domibacillus sp. DTU_2020_1001157_1_SI_ALB_TIR_016]|uniref:hypothetical protein n=1 Tax=Domibacillus sp. DTU_2020_1001157_1_SI_ALB_TIR_016 TaxID=3077789 RepID=UPI0028E42DCD|nr:hypothetical protein [Domibacillus sp. DTU_2020_1001157_1_SI_ALB_TIR_016]WNS79089.1 hypothetical protein RRU94_04025 [Domibacillus sp. DTU_2020_1001157_1_SI_ALB_TIR_016]
MAGDAFFAVFPILTLFFYIAPIIFLVWFLIRFLKIQQEKNQILKVISDKLDKLVK